MKVLDWGEDGLATAAETAALRSSFQQEVAVWHKLDHPNVTKVKVLHFSLIPVRGHQNICISWSLILIVQYFSTVRHSS